MNSSDHLINFDGVFSSQESDSVAVTSLDKSTVIGKITVI